MKLSKNMTQDLIEEIEFVIEKMKSVQDHYSKLYYFSAVYGIMTRIFNFEYNPDLIIAHFVTSSTYNQIKASLDNPDKAIKIPDELFEKLQERTEELLNAIKKDENLYEVLKMFWLLGYATMGNGYYLYKKGLLKI